MALSLPQGVADALFEQMMREGIKALGAEIEFLRLVADDSFACEISWPDDSLRFTFTKKHEDAS